MDGRGDPSSSSGSTPTLSDLLQQSRKLNAQLGSRADLPSIQLGLDQIEAQSRKIAQSRATSVGGQVPAGTASGVDNDTKAHYFLANGGIDASGLADTINQANIAHAFEPLQPIFDTDVDSYLRHSHEQIILSAIEEGRRGTMADFHRNLAKAQTRDWEAQKLRILEELGQHHVQGSTDGSTNTSVGYGAASTSAGQGAFRASRSFTPSRTEMTSQGSRITAGGARSAKYLAVIERLNAHRIDSIPFALASALGEAAKASSLSGGTNSEGPGSQDLYDSWRALASILGEKDVSEGEFRAMAVRERQYAPAYLGDESGLAGAWLGREGRELRKTLASGALEYLQQHFNHHIETRIASNPVKAQLGGRPTILGTIMAFERVAFTDRDGKWPTELEIVQTAQGTAPVWSTIFYLLCTGNEEAALEFVSDHDDAIRALDSSAGGFLSYFKAWLSSADRALPKSMRDRFLTEYNNRFRGTFASEASDGYKMALFKLIGRIDVNKSFPFAVSKDTETWLWTQLSLVRETDSEEAGPEYGDALRDRLTLQDLGARVVKFGDRHFDAKGTRPLHYFTLLLLCGQFERAISFLFSRPQHQVDAVNFASALTYYGLLRVPPQAKASHLDILTSSVDPSSGQEVMMLDFAKLIQKYVRLFSRTDAKGGLQYIYLICLNADCAAPVSEEQTNRCHDLIRALVIETRQYFDLLGDVRSDGTKTPGVIERSLPLIRLADSRAFLTNIVGAAAAQSEADNRTRDAILLYNIAEEYDRVLDVVNRQLGLTLVEPPNPTSHDAPTPDSSLTTVDDIVQLARAILDNYERHSHILRLLSRNRRETCRMLLSLKECFELFMRNELEKALNLIESLELVPLRGDVVTITRKAESFKDMDDNIAKNLSEILLLVMNCVSKLYQNLKNSPYADHGRQQRLAEYRSKARALMLFAGMLRLRIEPSTFAQLTRLDVYLH